MKTNFFEKMHSELWFSMSTMGKEQSPISMLTRKMSNCKTHEDYRHMSRVLAKLANDAMYLADLLGDMADELEDATEG